MWQTVLSAQWYQVLALLIVFVATVWVIIYVTQGERRIPVKYAPRQAGKRMVQAQRSHLPLKMAAAGVSRLSLPFRLCCSPARSPRGICRVIRTAGSRRLSKLVLARQPFRLDPVCAARDGLYLLLHSRHFRCA
jgi:hypothetical protein